MGKFDGILICTDLDGTLYKNDGSISNENKEAIEYFKSEGGLFSIITGRLPHYAQEAYNAVKPNVPFGCINGAGLYDGEKDEYVFMLEMTSKIMEIVDSIEKKFPNVGIIVSTFYKTYFSKFNGVVENFIKRTRLPRNLLHHRKVCEPIAKVLLGTDDNEEMLAVQKAVSEHPLASEVAFLRSEKVLFDILPKNTHKGVALENLIKYLNVDKNKTIAVGDYYNDLGMFSVARYGIAVKNACKEALDAADIITVSNEEHAIARIISDIENGNIKF